MLSSYSVRVAEYVDGQDNVLAIEFLNGETVEGGVNVRTPVGGGKAFASDLWCQSVDPHALAVWWRKGMGELQSRGIEDFTLHVVPGGTRLFEFYAGLGFKFVGIVFEGKTR